MNRAQVEESMKLSVLNLALAIIGKQDEDLSVAKNMLYDRVLELVNQAEREGRARGASNFAITRF